MDKLIVKAYEKYGQYYAQDYLGRIWAGPARTKAILKVKISKFNKKELYFPKLILK